MCFPYLFKDLSCVEELEEIILFSYVISTKYFGQISAKKAYLARDILHDDF